MGWAFLTCTRWVQQALASGAMMRSTYRRAGMLVFLMFPASFAGCFGENGDFSLPVSEGLSIEVEVAQQIIPWSFREGSGFLQRSKLMST